MDALGQIREDIHEIKQDMKELKEMKFRFLGGLTVLSVLLTMVINFIEIWIKNNSGVLLWKSFNSNMPVSIEYDIDF